MVCDKASTDSSSQDHAQVVPIQFMDVIKCHKEDKVYKVLVRNEPDEDGKESFDNFNPYVNMPFAEIVIDQTKI